ncbi:MAG: FAD-binding protein [Bacillota bacterium]
MVPQNLADTVAEYNEFCSSGVDAAYNRPATSNEKPNLVALDTPPFYALRLIPTLYSTCGGPRKNEKGQVLNTKGEVIPRLYLSGVLGESAAQTYTVYGQNWSEIWNFGRIAGENAAAESLLG